MSSETLQVDTFKAMGRFYSWAYIFRLLARFYFHYEAVGVYGKIDVHKSLKALLPTKK